MKIEFIPMDVERDYQWLKIALPIPFTEDTKGIVAMDTEVNRPVAAVLFDMWTHSSVCLHWWIEKPMVLRHGFFEEIADYIFNTCEKTNMVGIMPESYVKPMKLAKHLGFTEQGRIKDGHMLGDDQIIMIVRVEDAGK